MQGNEVLVSLDLARGLSRPIRDVNNSRFDVSAKNGGIVILRIILIKMELLHSDQPVEFDPLAQVRCLVFENGANREMHFVEA